MSHVRVSVEVRPDARVGDDFQPVTFIVDAPSLGAAWEDLSKRVVAFKRSERRRAGHTGS